MRRHASIPRTDWRARVERLGLSYHSHDTGPYWDETACYEMEPAEVDELERAANTLHRLCIDAAEQVIARGWWARLGIPDTAVQPILRSWERDDFSLYGRFDFAYDGKGSPKMLEYNADTPTALLEASVVQWFWLEELHPKADQFNSIHERLIEAWKRWGGREMHFASVKDNAEDEQTVLYLRDTCEQAGVKTHGVFIDDLGWDSVRNCFVDLEARKISSCFKLYPWEWLWGEEFASKLEGDPVLFLEPSWKMLLSNKGILPILWELFPDHPNLLPAFDTPESLGGNFVRKPKLGREGSNVTVTREGRTLAQNGGDYGEEGFVWQQWGPVPEFDGQHPIFGVWVVDHEAAGMGVREDSSLITGNLSRFLPHYFLQS